MLTGGRKKSSGPLVLKRELREFAAKLQEQDAILATAIADQEKFLERETRTLEAELERLRQLQQAREKEAVSLDHDLRRATEEINRANSRVSVARLELERLKREEERAHEKRTAESSAGGAEGRRAQRARTGSGSAARTAGSGAGRSAAHRRRARRPARQSRRRSKSAIAANVRLWHAWKTSSSEMSGRRKHDWRGGAALGRKPRPHSERKHRAGSEAHRRWPSRSQPRSAPCSKWRSRRRGIAKRWPQPMRRCATCACASKRAHARRSEIEVELTRRQSELQFLDETSRKELNVAVAELEAPADTSPEVLQADEKLVSGNEDEDRKPGRRESDGVRGISGSAAAPGFPDRAASGPARFHPRHRDRRFRRSTSSRRTGSPKPSRRSTRISGSASRRCSAAARARCASPTKKTSTTAAST